MLLSLRWLHELIPGLQASTDEIAHALTMLGLEIEATHTAFADLADVRCARVAKAERHPTADKLTVCEVSLGHETLTIVTGAPNVKTGCFVPVVAPGYKTPDGTTLAARKLQGIESQGMMLSEKELTLGLDHDGIMLLPETVTPGSPICDALDLTDTVLDLKVTPNRGDCLSHLGIARELAAHLNYKTGTHLTVTLPDLPVAESTDAASTRLAVTLDDPHGCRLYTARVIDAVTVAPTPWITPLRVRQKLLACGVRAISNIVDVTNYLLLESGQPMHAFDLAKLVGPHIVIRRAAPAEPFTTLDAVARTLDPEDLVIADASEPVALAGVMGGESSGVTTTTTAIALESAYFDPLTVRRAASRHKLRSESSYRFERGIDKGAVHRAQDRAAALIASIAGGRILRGIVEAKAPAAATAPIALRYKRVEALLGLAIDPARCDTILRGLGFTPADATPANTTPAATAWLAPTWRHDIELEADLIEEIARCHGFGEIPVTLPTTRRSNTDPATRAHARIIALEQAIRAHLASSGFFEAVNLPFMSEAHFTACRAFNPDTAVRVANPLSQDHAVLRTSMLPGLLANLVYNANRRKPDVRLYELGRVFRNRTADDHADNTLSAEAPLKPHPALPVETMKLGLIAAGRKRPVAYLANSTRAADEPIDFFWLKGTLEALLIDRLGLTLRFDRDENPMLHPGVAATISARADSTANDAHDAHDAPFTPVATVGQLHPAVATSLGLADRPFVAELCVSTLLTLVSDAVTKMRPVGANFAVDRDFAFIVDASLDAGKLLDAIPHALGDDSQLVTARTIFDIYTGKGIDEGKQSVALRLTFYDATRALSEDDLATLSSRLIAAFGTTFGAQLRA